MGLTHWQSVGSVNICVIDDSHRDFLDLIFCALLSLK